MLASGFVASAGDFHCVEEALVNKTYHVLL